MSSWLHLGRYDLTRLIRHHSPRSSQVQQLFLQREFTAQTKPPYVPAPSLLSASLFNYSHLKCFHPLHFEGISSVVCICRLRERKSKAKHPSVRTPGSVSNEGSSIRKTKWDLLNLEYLTAHLTAHSAHSSSYPAHNPRKRIALHFGICRSTGFT